MLLSDGFDNKGCDQGNPAKLSAVQAAATLPAEMPIYMCAMGPTSDQDLLAQLADDTNGLFYYMPDITDLYEIYNYIRGQVTGDGIIVNDSNTASASRVAGFVDACARAVTFSVAWGDEQLRYVPREPRKANEISIRLRDPKDDCSTPTPPRCAARLETAMSSSTSRSHCQDGGMSKSKPPAWPMFATPWAGS